jgi:hypothetical protein
LSLVVILTIQYYFLTIQLHYRHLVTNVLDSKDEIPRINQLHFHLTHQDNSCEELLLVRLHS